MSFSVCLLFSQSRLRQQDCKLIAQMAGFSLFFHDGKSARVKRSVGRVVGGKAYHILLQRPRKWYDAGFIALPSVVSQK